MNIQNPVGATDWQAFAEHHVTPRADGIDRDEHIPAGLIQALRDAGAFASGFPEPLGGPPGSQDAPEQAALAHGRMHEAFGRASASVQGLVNVHHMGGSALLRWGSKAQKAHWGPRITSGQVLAAIAMTEPNVGSDVAAVETRATLLADGNWQLDGQKAWITCGQSADIFVLIAGSDQGPTAFILPRLHPGVTVEPIPGMLGCRGYMMARLLLADVVLPADHLIGRPGFGVSHVAAAGLDAGRLNLAWGCVGLGQACLDAAAAYAKSRTQFGQPISEFQLVQQLLTRMMTDVQAARLLCAEASRQRAARAQRAVMDAAIAKYFASKMVNRAAHDAIQVHGANGCGPDMPLQRYYRDARIMEVIEGTTQVLETVIARYGLQGL